MAGSLLVLAILAWTATFFYWHFRIQGAIQVFEGHPTSHEEDVAGHTLTAAGCRALPYLTASLDSDKEAPTLELLLLIFGWSCSKSGFSDDPESRFQEDLRFLDECRMDRGKTPESRRRSYDRIGNWWRESGPRYHSWWRVWTPNCRKGSR